MATRDEIRLALLRARQAGDRAAVSKLEAALQPFAMAQPPALSQVIPQAAPEAVPLSQTIPQPASEQAAPAPQLSPLDAASQYIRGYGASLAEQAEGLKYLGSDFARRLSSGQSVGQALFGVGREMVQPYIEDPSLVASQAKEFVETATSGPFGAGQATGEILGLPTRVRGPAKKEIIIGEKSPLFNKKRMDKAIELSNKGVLRDQIWRETGSYKGRDGKWRQEVSDEAFKLKEEFGRQAPTFFQRVLGRSGRPGTQEGLAENILVAEKLFEAYPDLKKYAAKVEPIVQSQMGRGGVLGMFEPSKKKVTARSFAESGALDTLIHEFQHAIQRIEGWDTGVNPKDMAARLNISEKTAADMYWLAAGEVEARMAARRRMLTEEQRRQYPPYLKPSYGEPQYGIDVPPERVIRNY
jgi:hypothetical protein